MKYKNVLALNEPQGFDELLNKTNKHLKIHLYSTHGNSDLGSSLWSMNHSSLIIIPRNGKIIQEYKVNWVIME